MIATVGSMIEQCLYSIAGCYDQAITCVTTNDVGANGKFTLDRAGTMFEHYFEAY